MTPLRVITAYVEPDGPALLQQACGPVYVCPICRCGIRAYAWGRVTPVMINAHNKKRHAPDHAPKEP